MEFDDSVNGPIQWWDSDETAISTGRLSDQMSYLSPGTSPITPTSDLFDSQQYLPSWLSATEGSGAWDNYPSANDQNYIPDNSFSDPYLFPNSADSLDCSLGQFTSDSTSVRPVTVEPTRVTRKMPRSGSKRSSAFVDEIPSLEPEEAQNQSSPLSSNGSITDALDSTVNDKPSKRRKRTLKTRPMSDFQKEPIESPPSPTLGGTMKSNGDADQRKARSNHNQIERKYRDRLNGQFEMLAEALAKTDTEDSIRSEPDTRQFSKAELLAMARRRIRLLEKEVESRNYEVEQLRDSLSHVQDPTLISMTPWGKTH